MTEPSEHPGKAVGDPESYREALDGWMRRQHPELEALRVHDVDMPKSTGFSNETVFFSTSWGESGDTNSRRWVARIEPADGGIFPTQTPATANVESSSSARVNDVSARSPSPDFIAERPSI